MSCPACGGPLAPWMSVPSGEPADERTFPLLRCERCGSAVTGGDPPGPDAYESGVYSPEPPRAAALVRALQGAALGQPVRMLRRGGLRPGARVLDAGAGRGRLVQALRSAGFDARGIEPAGRNAVPDDPPVERHTIAEHRDSGLDAVVLWHVLEHLDDPAGALEHVRGWLAPGGLLLVALPNAASLQARIGGGGWLHWDAPRHRVHLTPAGLDALLERAALAPVRTAHMVWEHNPAGMWMALLSRLGMTPGFPFHLLKRNVRAGPRDVALLALGVPLAPLAVALEAGAGAGGRGGTIATLVRASR